MGWRYGDWSRILIQDISSSNLCSEQTLSASHYITINYILFPNMANFVKSFRARQISFHILSRKFRDFCCFQKCFLNTETDSHWSFLSVS